MLLLGVVHMLLLLTLLHTWRWQNAKLNVHMFAIADVYNAVCFLSAAGELATAAAAALLLLLLLLVVSPMLSSSWHSRRSANTCKSEEQQTMCQHMPVSACCSPMTLQQTCHDGTWCLLSTAAKFGCVHSSRILRLSAKLPLSSFVTQSLTMASL
jgi:hypothetical protein